MKYDIARQTLVPAFLTLVLLAAVFAWYSDICGWYRTVVAPDGGMAVGTPDGWLAALAAARPSWARAVAVAAFLFAAMSTGRMSVRHNLYGVGTCLAIPLAGIFMVGMLPAGEALQGAVAALLLSYSTKNFARSFRNGYAFDALLRAGGYLGLLVVLLPAALPLAVLLPFAAVLFRRTLREAAVALFGLLLPLSLFAYVTWGGGGSFAAPFERFGGLFVADGWLGLWRSLSPAEWLFAGFLSLLDLAAVGVLLRNLYGTGIQSRLILFYNIGVLATILLACCTPAAGAAVLSLAALPSAVLVPTLFVRVRPAWATLLYALSAAVLAVKIALQYSI